MPLCRTTTYSGPHDEKSIVLLILSATLVQTSKASIPDSRMLSFRNSFVKYHASSANLSGGSVITCAAAASKRSVSVTSRAAASRFRSKTSSASLCPIVIVDGSGGGLPHATHTSAIVKPTVCFFIAHPAYKFVRILRYLFQIPFMKSKSPEGFRTQGFGIHFVGTSAPTRPNGLHCLFLCPERFARLTRGASDHPVTR